MIVSQYDLRQDGNYNKEHWQQKAYIQEILG